MKHRKLRIAWSVAWGIVVVLLIGVWVRSYRTEDAFYWNRSGRIVFASRHGQIRMSTSKMIFVGSPLLEWHTLLAMPDGVRNWTFQSHQDGTFVVVPHGFPIAGFILFLIAAQPWTLARAIDWRFSLRTLLIATTLVGLGLGIVVWSMR
jgi:hypothetical protein